MKRAENCPDEESEEKRKTPIVDMGACTDCESCLELCAAVFRKNREKALEEIKKGHGSF